MEMDAFLASVATLAGKQFICHVLSVYGSEKSVHVLAAMLKSDATAEMALYTLERITAEEVDEELLDQLDDARRKGPRRHYQYTWSASYKRSSLPDLVALMQDKDPLVASAAIHAVGRIGGEPPKRCQQPGLKYVHQDYRMPFCKSLTILLQGASAIRHIVFIPLFIQPVNPNKSSMLPCAA